jgi:two-component system osmolarity sensor histidine kinase EnvZ
MARYRALIQELAHADLVVRQVALSRQDRVTTTWLEVATTPGQYRWVGISEDVEAASLWGSTGFGLLLALGIVVASAWWMSRALIRPLSELKTAMQTYTQTGAAPTLQFNKGPVETRAMAAQFVDLVRQREQNDRTREVMLAGISHDLRSPLGRIRMGAELLPDGADSLAWKKIIVDNVVLADRLLESFMDYARSQQLTLDSAVDLRALVTQQCSLRNIPVVCNTDLPAQLVVMPANALGLERALDNLLDNAQKYGVPPIDVTLMVQDARLLIVLSDHGTGVDASQIDQLLQPFHRGQASRNTPGTGLGLAIVNETVRRHGGQLRLLTTASGFSVEVALPYPALL